MSKAIGLVFELARLTTGNHFKRPWMQYKPCVKKKLAVYCRYHDSVYNCMIFEGTGGVAEGQYHCRTATTTTTTTTTTDKYVQPTTRGSTSFYWPLLGGSLGARGFPDAALEPLSSSSTSLGLS